MSLTNEERQAIVKHRLEKSHKAFFQVKNIVPMGYIGKLWRTACTMPPFTQSLLY